ncbi:MAG: hypothetical protein ACO3FW_08885, partial [Burkholderiaceae bacterium]
MKNLIEAYERIYRKWIPGVIAVPHALITIIVFFNAIGRKFGVPFPLTVIFKQTEGGRKQSLRVLGQKLYGKQFNKIAPQMALPMMIKT